MADISIIVPEGKNLSKLNTISNQTIVFKVNLQIWALVILSLYAETTLYDTPFCFCKVEDHNSK